MTSITKNDPDKDLHLPAQTNPSSQGESIGLSLSLTGCATIFKGTTERVSLNSEPHGAEVYVNEAYVGDTPLRLKLETKHAYRIEFRKDGYKSTWGRSGSSWMSSPDWFPF